MSRSPVFEWSEGFSNKIQLNQCQEVLDIGCRKGEMSSYLARHYPNQYFTAIDNLPSEIDQAQQYRTPNLSFEIADIYDLNCHNYFDAVVSFNCLHWVQDKLKALSNIFEALKPGGKVFLQFFIDHGRLKNDRFLYHTAQTSDWKVYLKGFAPRYYEVTLAEFVLLLQKVGFLTHRLDIIKYGTHFEHPDALWAWLGTWGSSKDYIPCRKQDYFLQDVVQAYLDAHHYSSQESFIYNEYLLEVICTKPHKLDRKASQEFSLGYGNITFTPKEVAVLKYYLQGNTAKEIARRLNVSPKTVEFHVGNIKQKLCCSHRSEIYQSALTHGFMNLIYS